MLKNLMVLAIALGFSATAYGVTATKEVKDHADKMEASASASGSEMEGSASEEMKK